MDMFGFKVDIQSVLDKFVIIVGVKFVDYGDIFEYVLFVCYDEVDFIFCYSVGVLLGLFFLGLFFEK